jgi:alcohol dehydrogenase (cytochrome c)
VNDIDATEIPILIDADFRGRPRKLLLFANRNGFFYIFDRVTGEYLHAKAFARQTWTKGLDEKGRPIPNPDTVPSPKGALVYSDDDGITNWFSPSYSPQTKMFYQNVREKGGIYCRNEAVYQPGRMYLGATKRAVPDEEPWGALRALDPLTGDVKWEFRVTTPPWCGLLSTAGGLVFSGTMQGNVLRGRCRIGQAALAISNGRRDLVQPDQLSGRWAPVPCNRGGQRAHGVRAGVVVSHQPGC